MKVNTSGSAPIGSFGIPQEIKDLMAKKHGLPPSNMTDKSDDNNITNNKITDGFTENVEQQIKEYEKAEENQTQQEDSLQGPLEALKSIGIAPSDDDFHSLIFLGSVQKTINIFSIPFTEKQFTAKMKTLTAHEIDLVDELLMAELDKTSITRDGALIRKNMWILSFAILELQGKPLCPKKKDIEEKEVATLSRKTLSALSPYILDLLLQKHAIFSTSFNLLLSDPQGKIVKK